MSDSIAGLENKAGFGANPGAGGGAIPRAGGDAGAVFAELANAFEAFREANDERLAEIERKAVADVVTSDKVDRIAGALDEQKRALDRLLLRQARPALGRPGGPTDGLSVKSEHVTAFEAYVRSGDDRLLRSIEQKAMSYGSAQDGGYLVPDETEAEIGRRLALISPIRGIASVRQVTGAVLKKPFAVSGPAVGWVGETAARPQTATPTLAELSFPTVELYAMPAATASLLDDSAVDIDRWIAGEVETAFAEQEGAAFVAGDGANKPRGFLDYDQVV